MQGPASPPTVTFKPGWPDTYSDEELDALSAEAAGAFIHAAAAEHLNAVPKGEVLDLIRGEIHRRGLRDAQAKAREARPIAIGALLLATVVGVVQIIVAIAIA
jgi:hypothetical protein